MRGLKAVVIGLVFLNLSCASEMKLPAEQEAPDFTLRDARASEIRLSDYRHNHAVLLDFFASWCPSCIKALGQVNAYHEAYKDAGLIVLGVNIRETETKVKQLIEKHNLGYPVLLDLEGETAASYGVRGIPYKVIIDKNGNIRWAGHILDGKAKSLLQEILN